MEAVNKAQKEVDKLNEEKKLLQSAITTKEACDKYFFNFFRVIQEVQAIQEPFCNECEGQNPWTTAPPGAGGGCLVM